MQKLFSALVLAGLVSGASTVALAQEGTYWSGRNPGAPRAPEAPAPQSPPPAAPAPRAPQVWEPLEGGPVGAASRPERQRGDGSRAEGRNAGGAGRQDLAWRQRGAGAYAAPGAVDALEGKPSRPGSLRRESERTAPGEAPQEAGRHGEARQGDGRWRSPGPARDDGRWGREERTRTHGGHRPERYHAGRFQRPPGWSARAWRRDQYVPRNWLGLGYLYVEPWDYALPVAPPRSAWMRLGEDAVLVDLRTGRILQVAPGLFW